MTTPTVERSLLGLKRKSWTIDDYHAMIDAGILTEEDKVELLFGQIIEMNPVGRAHSTTVKKINKLLQQRFPGDEFVIGVQDPVTLVDDSEPEPDVYVARGPLAKYLNYHPGPTDILLLIEVSDSTLREDRTTKKAVYATAGIVEYWIVNVYERQIERFTNPQSATGEYAQSEIFSEKDEIESIHLGRLEVENLFVQY